MELKETERTVIAKPVASRPTTSFRSFSELPAGAINVSTSSETAITPIRPKTVRFKPAVSSPPFEMVSSKVGITDKVSKSNSKSPILYKPLAKTVSTTTVSLLANMGAFTTSHQAAVAQNCASQSETGNGSNHPKLENDQKSQHNMSNGDWPSYDGYNWRKYGQKQVKGSEYPRSYYKCTHPSCPVKKKVERSVDGEIAEIVYKGEHNHPKPRFPRRHTSDGTRQDSNHQRSNSQLNDRNEGSEGGTEVNGILGSSSHLTNMVKLQESCDHVSSEAFSSMPTFDRSCGAKVMIETPDDEPTSKRSKILHQSNKAVTYADELQEPRIIVQNATDSEIISDGFRWRKYGQKVVKGNPYPRSYYRCTGLKCNVRKHVERASDDPGAFITTYEGKHNHEMPTKRTNAMTSKSDLQQPASLL